MIILDEAVRNVLLFDLPHTEYAQRKWTNKSDFKINFSQLKLELL
jgi:hypothetical protein